MEEKRVIRYSARLQQDMEVRIYGTAGRPMLAFPTQDGMAGQWQGFGMVDLLKPWIDTGRIQLYTVDTVDIRSWSADHTEQTVRSAVQEAYFQWIVNEVVPLIAENNPTGGLPLLTGCSLGGSHCAICLIRRPDLFCGMIGLSGAYDCRYFTKEYTNEVWLQNSPVDIMKTVDAVTIDLLRHRSIVLCCGQGKYEDIELEAIRILEKQLSDNDIPAWVDYWGTDVDHDWVWWKPQLTYFLPFVLEELDNA